MFVRLTDAPLYKPLVVAEVTNPDLALRLQRMGLFEGTTIIRMDQEVLVHPVRVRGPRGDAVLGGGMAMHIVVHLDDGRRLPLSEMKPGESGHIEGLTGGSGLSQTMNILALHTDDRIVFLRKLPPMEYIAVIENAGRVRLTEGMAAKIWGRMTDRSSQFVSAGVGEKFHVQEILGGGRARAMLASRGVEPGKVLILEKVAQAQNLSSGVRNPVIISSLDGLRLFLSDFDGNRIRVREADGEPGK